MPEINYSKWDDLDTGDEGSGPEDPLSVDLDVTNRQLGNGIDENLADIRLHEAVREDKERHGKGPVAIETCCYTCGARRAAARCGKCRAVFFCNYECQVRGWKAHKFNCRQIKADAAKEQALNEEYTTRLRRQADEERDRLGGELGPYQRLINEELAKRGPLAPMPPADAIALAIVVPYREQLPLQERACQLREFVTFMHDHLTPLVQYHWLKRFKILVVQQSDDGRKFNRGALLNVGFDLIDKDEDFVGDAERTHVMFHDVDLIPDCDALQCWYAPDLPTGFVIHMTAEGYPKYCDKRKVPGSLGGVLGVRREDYRATNGYPNDVWGWACKIEDRCLADRFGARMIRNYECPGGKWRDLDRVDMRSETSMSQYRPFYDDTFFGELVPAQPEPPRGKDGQVVPGPAAPVALSSSRNASRTGGLDTLQYTVRKREPCYVKGELVEVHLDF